MNLTTQYKKALLDGLAKVNLITASTKTNRFAGAKGLSGFVPAMYAAAAYQFYKEIVGSHQQSRISIWEYFRTDWTFHGKGLWCSVAPSNNSLPNLTVVGSANFGMKMILLFNWNRREIFV